MESLVPVVPLREHVGQLSEGSGQLSVVDDQLIGGAGLLCVDAQRGKDTLLALPRTVAAERAVVSHQD